MRILVADDDSLVRAIAQRVVGLSSHELLQAENGLDALRIIEREDPDVLITDIHMPVMDGFELVEAIRSTPRYAGLPVICLSADNDRDTVSRFAALGITEYLLKPVRPRDLADRLGAVMSRFAQWKQRRVTLPSDAAAPAVIVVDRDPVFRTIVEETLSPDFTVVAASNGPDGVARFRQQTVRVAGVLIASALDLLNDERVAAMIRRSASEHGLPSPRLLLVTASGETVAPEKASKFDGVVTRTSSPDEFLAAVAEWLPKGAPCTA